MKIVTAAEMREIDRRSSERFGVPSLSLMENAGRAVAAFVLQRFPQAKTIGVICGKGNNGGDGFVAARHLKDAGREVRVLLLADPGELRGDAAEMYGRMGMKALSVRAEEELASDKAAKMFACDLLVDAVLGTGFKPPVSGVYEQAIRKINERAAAGVPVVAVDIPSGLDADQREEAWAGEFVRAEATVTFTAPRPAHVFAPQVDGRVIVASAIGSPPEAIESKLNLEAITPRDIYPVVAPRERDAHKGNFGHVLVIGGSVGKAGAAAMAGMAALRAGTGLVTVATTKSVLPTVASFAAELMTEPLEETDQGTISLRALEYGRLDAILKGKDVLAIGPGISRNVETAELVRTLVRRAEVPIVLDADGLNAFEGAPEKLDGTGRQLILTPHPGEMARLAGISTAEVQKDRISVARKFAQEHAVIVVLKGHRTVVATPDGTAWINPTGNPGMASGGMGDILTGLIAGLAGQEYPDRRLSGREVAIAVERRNQKRLPEAPTEAEREGLELAARIGVRGGRPELPAIAGVYLHGLAGDIGAALLGEHSLAATDLLTYLPEAFAKVRELAASKFSWISVGASRAGAPRC